MQDQTYVKTGTSKVVKQLAPSGRRQCRSRFDFNDKYVVDDHVYPVDANTMAFEKDLDRHFSANCMASRAEFDLECGSVDILKETKPQHVVHVKEGSDH